jgi:hypothetical protein
MEEAATMPAGADADAAQPELSAADIDAETAQPLPDRQAMSKIGLDVHGVDNFAMVLNEATAMNVASEDSIAVADADQVVIIGQVDQD